MAGGFYESDAAVEQYLLFHYGTPAQICPLLPVARAACGFPARCVSEPIARMKWNVKTRARFKQQGRALDLGCATGRSSFELRRHFGQVLGIDFSERFVAAARQMRQQQAMTVRAHREGPAYDEMIVGLPKHLRADHVEFEKGDACALRADLGSFDFVLMANLVDRLPDPVRCLARLPKLVSPGGWLVITSPYTWLEEYTPRDKWLIAEEGGTLGALRKNLASAFALREAFDLPFLIREHRRKFQWSVAQASVWQRR